MDPVCGRRRTGRVGRGGGRRRDERADPRSGDAATERCPQPPAPVLQHRRGRLAAGRRPTRGRGSRLADHPDDDGGRRARGRRHACDAADAVRAASACATRRRRSSPRPMAATVAIGAAHCAVGAGDGLLRLGGARRVELGRAVPRGCHGRRRHRGARGVLGWRVGQPPRRRHGSRTDFRRSPSRRPAPWRLRPRWAARSWCPGSLSRRRSSPCAGWRSVRSTP